MNYLKLLSAFILLFAFGGCTTEQEFDGPSLNDLYGDFSILQPFSVAAEQVDFSSGASTHFTAAFSKNVEWKIRITGLQSGAEKEITGFSNLIDQSNSAWKGTITTLPLFKQEVCAVELTFTAEVDTLRDTLSILETRVNEGLLLSDFENGTNPDWTSFVQSGANMSFVVQSADSAAQGSHYFDIGGTVNWDWLIAYLYMPASAYGSPTFNLSSNASQVYFNAMLYKPRELSNGLFLFQFTEDDNEDGTFSAATEDMYSIEVPMTQNGWSQLSIRYSDLTALVNGQPAAPAGNGVLEPNKLFRVQILFLANPNSGYAHAFLDYLIFTEGAALEP